MIKRFLMILSVILLTITISTKPSFAAVCCKPPGSCPCDGDLCYLFVTACSLVCSSCSENYEGKTTGHFDEEVQNQKDWMINIFWKDTEAGDTPGLLAAMMLMTKQLTANTIQRTQIIGTFFDAKHQLETQRLFQTLTARAHKDYHPSEELCTVGTAVRSLAASERISDLVSTAYSKRSIDRQLLSKHTIGMEDGTETDQRSRLLQFITHYCNPEDNTGNLGLLCKKKVAPAETKNKDINYTTAMDLPLTLDIDLEDEGVTADERNIHALTSNLISHQIMPSVANQKLMSKDITIPAYGPAAVAYLDSRALVAKRSVAANSLTAIAALKASGSPESTPFIYAIIKELSPEKFNIENIKELIGEYPSYFAQMEVLTKKLYQNPKFYSDLYDKPANVMRKDVAIQAAELMQKRDIYRSLLRSEVTMATMLEAALLSEQEKLKNEINPSRQGK
jgi:hypothetical protein